MKVFTSIGVQSRTVPTTPAELGKPYPVRTTGFVRPGRRFGVFVGGSGTRGMNHYLAAAMAADPRIRIGPGDPLPHLHRSDVCVHAAYELGLPVLPDRDEPADERAVIRFPGIG